MGMVLTTGKFSIIQQELLQKPLVFCNPDKTLKANAVSINVEMAKKLSTIQQNRRRYQNRAVLSGNTKRIA